MFGEVLTTSSGAARRMPCQAPFLIDPRVACFNSGILTCAVFILAARTIRRNKLRRYSARYSSIGTTLRLTARLENASIQQGNMERETVG